MEGLETPNQESLANLLGVRQGMVSAWLNRRKRPGSRHIFNIERATGIKPESWAKVALARSKSSEGRAA